MVSVSGYKDKTGGGRTAEPKINTLTHRIVFCVVFWREGESSIAGSVAIFQCLLQEMHQEDWF